MNSKFAAPYPANMLGCWFAVMLLVVELDGAANKVF